MVILTYADIENSKAGKALDKDNTENWIKANISKDEKHKYQAIEYVIRRRETSTALQSVTKLEKLYTYWVF